MAETLNALTRKPLVCKYYLRGSGLIYRIVALLFFFIIIDGGHFIDLVSFEATSQGMVDIYMRHTSIYVQCIIR